MEKKYNDFIGDILDAAKEKNKQFEGSGKPLSKDSLKMDTYEHFLKIAKDAGYLPSWIKLKKEISELMHTCQTEKDVQTINKKISKYNKICPNSMQRNPISLEKLERAKKFGKAFGLM